MHIDNKIPSVSVMRISVVTGVGEVDNQVE